jgi:hypothetical protein
LLSITTQTTTESQIHDKEIVDILLPIASNRRGDPPNPDKLPHFPKQEVSRSNNFIA